MLLVSVSFANRTHVVQKGDNDHTIARKYGISVAELHKSNPNVNWNRIQIGQKLTVPKSGSTASRETGSKSSRSAVASKPTAVHTVVAGESDWSIARKYGMTVEALKALNPSVSFSPLKAGAKVKVHAAAATPTRTASKPVEVVKSAPTKATTSKYPEVTTVNAEIAKASVIVRTEASTNSGKVVVVDKGTVARVVDRKNEWYKLVFSGGKSGWVRADMLKNTDKQVTALAKPAPAATKPATKPAVASKSTPTASGNALINTAYTCLGIRYVYGGTSRSGFDCSGFVGWVYRQHGINLPRTAAQMWGVGRSISRSELRSGDLLFFRTRGSRISHVGMYIGNNRFIHASSGGGRIRVNDLSGYYAQRYAGARRISDKFSSTVDQTNWDKIASQTPVEEPPFDVDPEPEPVPTQVGTDITQD
ncbi:MAG: C40 family peptidase [Armatimonadetes bacterium]|nr:C40 family peptidase [Armatimonadota bacterium]